jgi:hypothetical protein
MTSIFDLSEHLRYKIWKKNRYLAFEKKLNESLAKWTIGASITYDKAQNRLYSIIMDIDGPNNKIYNVSRYHNNSRLVYEEYSNNILVKRIENHGYDWFDVHESYSKYPGKPKNYNYGFLIKQKKI